MKFSTKFARGDDANQDGRYARPKLPLLASLSSSSTASSASSSASSGSDQDQFMMDDDQTPPISPALRSPPCMSSASSTPSWSQAAGSGQSSPFDFDIECSNGSSSSSSSSSQCNSKEDRATYNTKFAKFHLETYRQNDRMRWNFDFDHNRPLEDSHHHHHHSVPRYQWEPAL